MGMWKRFLMATATVAAGALASPAASAEDMNAMKKELELMKERLAKLEADKAAKKRIASAAAVEAGDKPRSWKLPGTNTSMNVGGFVEAQFIWDFSGGAAASAQPGAPGNLAGSNADNRLNGGHVQFQARRTRLWFQTWTPTDWGEMRTYIELDFGSSTPGYDGTTQVTEQLRMRQAFGTLGPVLAGQAPSTMSPAFAFPDLIDGNSPVGTMTRRQVQLRYTHNLHSWLPGLVLELAAEDPRGDTIVGTVTGNAANRFPDLVAALDYTSPTFRIKVAGLLRQIEHDTGGVNALSDHDQALGWGVNVGFRWTPMPELAFMGSAAVGRGIGKYIDTGGGIDAITRQGPNNNCATCNTTLEAVMSFAASIGMAWRITDTVTFNAGYGYHWQDVAAGLGKQLRNAAVGGRVETQWSAGVNLQWSPVPQVTLTAEYGYYFIGAIPTTTPGTVAGGRFTGITDNGNIHRLTLAARYRF